MAGNPVPAVRLFQLSFDRPLAFGLDDEVASRSKPTAALSPAAAVEHQTWVLISSKSAVAIASKARMLRLKRIERDQIAAKIHGARPHKPG